MSGRYEKESQIENKIKEKIKYEPNIFTDYFYDLLSSGKSYATIYVYLGHILNFSHFICGEEIPDQFYLSIKPTDINRYIATLRTKTVKNCIKRTSDSMKTVQWSALNSFFNFLVPDYLNKNPVSSTSRPKMKDNPKVTYLTDEEVQYIRQNISEKANHRMVNRDLCLFELGIKTGLRISAIIQIDISDIDFNNNVIHVIEKGNKSYEVLIGERMKCQIKKWILDRNMYFPNIKTDALFVSQENKRLSSRTVKDILDKYCIGINKKITPHVMRHTCATNLYEKTGDIYLCSAQLHHANVSTTQRYAEISNKKQKYATNILDELI